MNAKYSSNTIALIFVILALVLSSSACVSSTPVEQIASTTRTSATPAPTNAPPTQVGIEIPYDLISQESLFAYLEDLTAIQAYSGWRNSASSGEAEALDYVERTLRGFPNLQKAGLELERETFHVFLSTEIWTSDLTLTIGGQSIEVPSDAIRGNRFDQPLASYFDSDGAVNDSDSDPLSVSGLPLVVRSENTLNDLDVSAYKDRILFLDYSLIDRYTNSASGDESGYGANANSVRLLEMTNKGLAGMVLVTSMSSKFGASHGMGASEGTTVFGWNAPNRHIPILYVRIEDLSPAGIENWDDLAQIESAQLTLDTDVFYPGTSGNLIARIPGMDTSKAVILGAHIDTPNNPGALDDGSGSAALLEIARVLNDSQIQPPVDVYLAWFGSEELGVYGSSYFVSTHQDLLDHTLAMLQMDGLGAPLKEADGKVTLVLASYDRFGESSIPLYDFLSEAVATESISLDRFVEHGLSSDNNIFEAFDVPNADTTYLNSRYFHQGSRPIHYYVHWHEPYDDMERARTVGPAFVDMAKTMLAAALEIGRLQPNLRVTPSPTHRALIVASHTESFGLPALRELGAALSWEGFDVDLIPYGQPVIATDLEGAGMIILPPAMNSPGNSPETWGDEEITLLQQYVSDGGLLVVVNSAYDYVSTLRLYRTNISARSANPLLEAMGIRFRFGGAGSDDTALAVAEHPLTLDATYFSLHGGNAMFFKMQNGLALVNAVSNRPLIGMVDFGAQGGQVLVIAEVGLIQDIGNAKNLQFLKNLAHYAATR